jgi:heme A synthase
MTREQRTGSWILIAAILVLIVSVLIGWLTVPA